MVNDPDSSFGFMLSLEDETYYRALTFASSDDVNPSMRPSLLIIYQIPASGCFRLQAMNECGIDALVWNAPGFRMARPITEARIASARMPGRIPVYRTPAGLY